MAYQIKLAGQDITLYVDQMSIEISDSLGQGGGAGSSGATQGRAATCKFNTNLGPMSSAIGAGQPIPGGGTPVLVRQGEVIISDSTGILFGGFITKYTDTTTSVLGVTKKNFTAAEGIDYSTSLQRTLVNEVFTGASDTFIIRTIMQKYAPWINLQYLPNTTAYTFADKRFRNQTVEQVIQTIAGITGYLVYVDYSKNLRYVAPTVASSAPFNLSDNPDFVSSFTHAVTEYLVDDNAIINRVYFFGGSKLSNDYTQDLSPLANGTNTTFPLAYYPSPKSDGKYHVLLNGVELVVGFASGGKPGDTFKSKGGLADVLIDPGSKVLIFDVAPAAGATVQAGYRYSHPLSVVLTDEKSHAFFGNPYLDGVIDDNTIFDTTTAVQRCKVLLSQQSYGLTSLKVDIYKAGVQSGTLIKVKNTVRGINGTYLVQDVQIKPLGGGNFRYTLSLGAWNWNIIDFLLKMGTLATFQDNQTDTQDIVNIQSILSNVQIHDVWTKKTSTPGVYYARSAPVGDGHDAYPGFATITS